MRNLVALALVSASLAFAQATVTRTVRLANPQGMQEAATVLRTVIDMRTVSTDPASSSITFTDTPETAALAGWVLNAIDTVAPLSPQEYRPNGAADDVVHVVYLKYTNTPQGIQEVLTQLRTVLDLAKVFNATIPRALVFRGSAATVAATDWLIAQLDKPFDPHAMPVSYDFTGAARGGNQVEVFYLHNIATPKPTQELLTAIRMETKTQHVFNNTSVRAIAMRGTTDQIAAAARLVAERDVASN